MYPSLSLPSTKTSQQFYFQGHPILSEGKPFEEATKITVPWPD
jgi:hypothetical protein